MGGADAGNFLRDGGHGVICGNGNAAFFQQTQKITGPVCTEHQRIPVQPAAIPPGCFHEHIRRLLPGIQIVQREESAVFQPVIPA